MKARDPKTPQEWQEAVDAAHAFTLIESARCYGLITGGPAVDLDRCDDILRRGHARGIRPQPGSVEQLVAELLC